jgi:hypothetical protein
MFNKNPNYSNIEFGTPLKGKDNKYFINSSHTVDEETCDIICQFGPDVYNKNKINEEAQSVEFVIKNEKLLEFIKECDEQFLNLAKEKKEMFFPDQNITDNYLEQAFMQSIKSIKKTNVFKVRTSSVLGIFTSNRDVLTCNDIDINDKLSIIVQISGLWFTKTRFGITWMLKQIKKNETKADKVGESLFYDDDEESEELGNVFPDE